MGRISSACHNGMQMASPKVSVAMVTYNHEGFITEALESAVSQQTRFPFEVIVGEDCSTDRTRDIVLDYQSRYPHLIRPVLHPANIGGHKNRTKVFEACTGQYVAVLEGDDAWTSPHKLQRQVDFLDEHPDYAVCFHKAVTYYEETGSYGPEMPDLDQTSYTFEELLAGNFIPACSVMYRRGPHTRVPEWCGQVRLGDWPLHLLHARHGKIGMLPECMGTYRVHRGGAWSVCAPREANERIIRVCRFLSAEFGGAYDEILDRVIATRRVNYAFDAVEARSPDASRALAEAITATPPFFRFSTKALIAAKLYFRPVIRMLGRARRALKAEAGSSI